MFLPPGYSKVTFTWTLTGSSRFFQSSCDVQNLLNDGSPAVVLANVRTAFAGSNVLNTGNMFTGYVMSEAKILMKTLGGILLTANDLSPLIGSKSGDGMSANTSVIVKKTVAQAGRKYRGRFLWPPFYFLENSIDRTGIISSTATYQTLWTQTHTALLGNNPPVLLHSDPLDTPTPITAFTINGKIGTIGKRIRA